MAKKLGDLAIGLAVLIFMLGGISSFLNEADYSHSVSSGIAFSQLNSSANDLRGDMEVSIQNQAEQLENPNDWSQDDSDIEKRGVDTSAFINRNTKNIVFKFIDEVALNLGIDGWIIYLLVSLLSIAISVLFLRFFWGESRI